MDVREEPKALKEMSQIERLGCIIEDMRGLAENIREKAWSLAGHLKTDTTEDTRGPDGRVNVCIAWAEGVASVLRDIDSALDEL